MTMTTRPSSGRAAPPPECPLDHCLRLLAGAWTAKILWYLCEEPRRFGDLRRDLGGITSKVLSSRLRELEGKGVVAREVIPASPPQVSYRLTSLGKELRPVLEAMARLGEKAGQSSR
jgi:DNA-binding HxlR family transcriptional regulator